MNKKRNFPLYLIDRSRADSFPYDYVVCFDTIVGFVARVVHFDSDNAFTAFASMYAEIPNGENVCVTKKLRSGGLALVVEDFLFDMEFSPANNDRLQRLLKKGFKKYIFAEIDRTPYGEFCIDNQVKQQQLTVDRAKSQYKALVERSSVAEADYNIGLAKGILNTLKQVQSNQIYFKIYNN